MPREKIFSKLKYKDYNTLLEKVLETKEFPSTSKNLVLSILYKMEAGYEDYKNTKRDVTEKGKIITDLINIVQNNCDVLNVIKPESNRSTALKEVKEHYISDIKEKSLEVLPNERLILQGLYSLDYNANMVCDKYGLLKKAITYVLSRGASSNKAELIRDFNGYSWYISPIEFEDIYSNLIFQNIRIIAGNDLLEEWLNNTDKNKDYLQDLEKELTRRLDNKKAKELIHQMLKTMLVVYLTRFPEERPEKEQEEDKKTILKQLDEISRKKKKCLKEVERLDKYINNTTNLKRELTRRKKLGTDLENIEELREVLIKDRENYIKQIMKYNKAIDPTRFVKKVKRAKEVPIINYDEIIINNSSLEDEIIRLQKLFLSDYKILIEKLEGRREIIELMYEFRYYNLIPIDDETQIKDEISLSKEIDEVRTFLIKKALNGKIINVVNNNEYINLEVLKNIFSLRIINLENAEVFFQNTEDGAIVNYLEGNTEETAIKMIFPKDIGKYKIKENRKVKIFS